MTVKSIVRGVTVGATVGTVCYMMSKATSKQKHRHSQKCQEKL